MGRVRRTAASLRCRHLESVQESVDQSDGLLVTTVGAESLLEYEGPPDGGDDDREGCGREFVCVQMHVRER